ncbi:peptidase U35, phage prohead HK97 [Staphylococcus pseudintermedius]|nr:peptidase U35, phage prohead HK97 [Staphylococcus pseudintermedius]
MRGQQLFFNKPTQINTPTGSYTEIIKRNALDGLKLNDTRLLVSHDMNRIPLAKSPKTMDIWTDDVVCILGLPYQTRKKPALFIRQ